MHDTLGYMSRDPIHRHWHHNDVSFGLPQGSAGGEQIFALQAQFAGARRRPAAAAREARRRAAEQEQRRGPHGCGRGAR